MLNLKPIKSIIVGGHAFFKDFPEYVFHDIDEINILNEFPFKSNGLCMKMNNKDVFFIPNYSKEQVLLSLDDPLKIGKLLVPEYAEYIGLTINDLKSLKQTFNKLDNKHKYYKIIYNAYIENNDFVLTEQQRIRAFEEYKRERPSIYKSK